MLSSYIIFVHLVKAVRVLNEAFDCNVKRQLSFCFEIVHSLAKLVLAQAGMGPSLGENFQI